MFCTVRKVKCEASGTTIIAAEMSARKALCVEINPGYCDIAIARWQAFTRETARLQDGTAFAARRLFIASDQIGLSLLQSRVQGE